MCKQKGIFVSKRIVGLVTLMGLMFFFNGALIAQNCTVNAGIPQVVCESDTLQLAAIASPTLDASPNFTWSQLSGPNTATIETPGQTDTDITGLIAGSYKFQFTALCGDGFTERDSVVITVNPSISPPIMVDDTICQLQTFTAPDYGAGYIYNWEEYPSTGYPWDIYAPTSRITGIEYEDAYFPLDENNYDFILTVTDPDGQCSAKDTFKIYATGSYSQVCVGPDFSICGNNFSTTPRFSTNCASFSEGQVSFHGELPVQWNQLSGPNPATIEDPTLGTTSFTNLIPGIYQFEYVVTEVGECPGGRDTMLVVVTDKDPIEKNLYDRTFTYCDRDIDSILVYLDAEIGAEDSVTWVVRNVTKSGYQNDYACRDSLVIHSPNNKATWVSGFNSCLEEIDAVYLDATVSNGTCDFTITHTIRFKVWTLRDTAFYLSCGTTSYNFSYSLLFDGFRPSNSTQGKFWVSGPDIGYSPGDALPNTITGLVPGTYIARLEAGGCGYQSALVTFVVSDNPPAANAGTDPLIPCDTTYVTLSGNDPGSFPGVWYQISGPNTAIVDDFNSNTPYISGMVTGDYVFRWTIDGGEKCGTTSDEVLIRVTTQSPGLTTSAGANQNICYNTPTQLGATPPPAGFNGNWTVSPVGPVFSNSSDEGATITGLAASTVYTFTWTVTSTCDTATANVTVTTSGTEGPVASTAGSDQCLSSGTTSFTMSANSPLPSGTAGLWSVLSGPGSGSFSAPTSNVSSFNSAINGTYQLEWALSLGGCATTRDTVYVTISGTPYAGLDRNVCGLTGTLAATANTGSFWRQTSGPPGVVFADVTDANTSVTFPNGGSYYMEWVAGDASCAVANEVIVRVGVPEAAIAGTDQVICKADQDTVVLSANSVSSGFWFANSDYGSSSFTFDDPSSPNTVVRGLDDIGDYEFVWSSISDIPVSVCTRKDSMTVSVIPTAYAGYDYAVCDDVTEVKLITDANGSNSTTTWTTVSGPTTATFQKISETNYRAIGLASGVYVFRATVNAAGCSSSDEVTITVGEPEIADAGDNFLTCNSTVTLTGNTPSLGTASWELFSGPASGTFSNPTNPSTTYGPLLPNTEYIFRYILDNGSCESYDLVRVYLFSDELLSASVIDPTCGNSDGNIDLFIGGPTTAFSYSWTNGATSQDITGIPGGAYTVTVTHPEGCTASLRTIANNSDGPQVTVGPDTTICPGESVTLTSSATGGTPGYTYSWSNAETNPSISVNPTATTEYSITITDAALCSNVNFTTVTTNETIGLSLGNDTSFCSQSVVLTPTFSSGSGGTCTGTSISTFPFSETFESDLGEWTQGTSDDMNWTRDASGTPSSSTGPSSGANGSTYYLFMEASSNYNKSANLISPCLDFSSGKSIEVSFYYHMYGVNIGSLVLEASTDDGANWTQLWIDEGNKGNVWNKDSVDLSAYAGQPFLKVRFQGTTLSGYRGDIALDEISFTSSGFDFTWSTTETTPSIEVAPSTLTDYWISTTDANGCVLADTVAVHENCASLGNYIWLDSDKDGIQDADEVGMSGVKASLINDAGEVISATTTDAFGAYLFTRLDPGSYVVRIDEPINFVFSDQDQGADDEVDSDIIFLSGKTATISLSDSDVDLASGDAGLQYATPQTGIIGDYVWMDLDSDDAQSGADVAFAGIRISLFDNSGDLIASTMTDRLGEYRFTDISPGNYQVGATLPAQYKFVAQTTGTTTGSDADVSTGLSPVFAVAAGDTLTDIDFGLEYSGSTTSTLGDLVWDDLDEDGIQDAGEPGVQGVQVSLFGDDGVTVVATTTTDAEGVYRFTNLTPGKYHLQFASLPTDYVFTSVYTGGDEYADSDASPSGETAPIALGPGQVRDEFDAGIYSTAIGVGTAVIGDKVWYDLDEDGILDIDEPGTPGIKVILYDNSGNALFTEETDLNGYYRFTSLDAGTYSVGFSNLPQGYIFTAANVGVETTDSDVESGGKSNSIILTAGQNYVDLDAGIIPGVTPSGTVSIGGRGWDDMNSNGVQEDGELGISKVKVILYAGNGTTKLDSTETNTWGEYLFLGLESGTYVIEFSELPSGYNFSSQDQGSDDNLDSDANTSTGKTSFFTLLSGEDMLNIDTGLFPAVSLSSLGNFVWNDLDRDGTQDAGEPGVGGVTVTLLDVNGDTVSTTSTDKNGMYYFRGLAAGIYTAKFTNLPLGFGFTTAGVGSETTDSDANSQGVTAAYTLAASTAYADLDVGIYGDVATLGDFVWYDENGDGQQDLGEPGIAGVTVVLFDNSSDRFSSAVTDKDGYFNFVNLAAGTYYLGYENLPSGLIFSAKDNTGDDANDTDVNPGTGRTDAIVLAAGTLNRDADAGLYMPSPAVIGDFAWRDVNGDGIYQGTERAISGIQATLYDNGGNAVSAAVTNRKGLYLFDQVEGGTYTVGFSRLPGFASFTTKDEVSGTEATDSDVDTGTGISDNVVLPAGSYNENIDVGIVTNPILGGLVWYDGTRDGLMSREETTASGVTVELLDSDSATVVATTTTSGYFGMYFFTNITPGDYHVRFKDLPVSYGFTIPNVGSNEKFDSDAIPSAAPGMLSVGTTVPLTLGYGDMPMTFHAGLSQSPFAVEWLNFTAVNQGPDALLDWTTATETNSDIFEIERSLDGNFFGSIGEVTAMGTSSSPESYTYLDKNVAQLGVSKIYYRIKEVDQSGNGNYSNRVELSLDKTSLTTMTAYPNPIKDVLKLKLSSPVTMESELRILNSVGQQMKTFSILPTSPLEWQVDVSQWSVGIYYLNLFNEERNVTLKVLKE